MNKSNDFNTGEESYTHDNLDKENVTKISEGMEETTLPEVTMTDAGNTGVGSTRVHENGIKSYSPCEELVDSIEDVLVKSEDSVIEIETVEGGAKSNSHQIFAINNLKTSETVIVNDKQLSGDSVNMEQKQSDVKINEDLKAEKESVAETAEQENVELTDNLIAEDSAILDDSKVTESKSVESITVTKGQDPNNVEELLGATGGSVTPAQSKDDEKFRAMTEDEIQAIINKYSFMDREVRNKSLRFFWSLDVDRWGYFNYSHLRYWYRIQGSILTNQQILDIFFDLDKDGDSLVSLDEFLNEMSKKRPRRIRQDELREMFESWDINKDGYVCENDIRDKMETMNRVACTYDIYKALHYDTTGESRLNYKDFCRYAQDIILERIPMKQW